MTLTYVLCTLINGEGNPAPVRIWVSQVAKKPRTKPPASGVPKAAASAGMRGEQHRSGGKTLPRGPPAIPEVQALYPCLREQMESGRAREIKRARTPENKANFGVWNCRDTNPTPQYMRRGG